MESAKAISAMVQGEATSITDHKVAQMIARVVAISFCLTLSSCAALRLQMLHDKNAKTIWLSMAGDDASLKTLSRLNDGKATADTPSQIVMVEMGAQVYITQETKKHCSGMAVFKKVRVTDGPNKGLEGWICGASTTHRKVWVL